MNKHILLKKVEIIQFYCLFIYENLLDFHW